MGEEPSDVCAAIRSIRRVRKLFENSVEAFGRSFPMSREACARCYGPSKCSDALNERVFASGRTPPGLLVLIAPADQLSHLGTGPTQIIDRKSTRLNSSHVAISYAV